MRFIHSTFPLIFGEAGGKTNNGIFSSPHVVSKSFHKFTLSVDLYRPNRDGYLFNNRDQTKPFYRILHPRGCQPCKYAICLIPIPGITEFNRYKSTTSSRTKTCLKKPSLVGRILKLAIILKEET